MNTLQQKPLNQRTYGLDLLVPDRLQVGQTSRSRSSRVLMHQRQGYLVGLTQQTFYNITREGTININGTHLQQVEAENIQCHGGEGGTKYQRHLYWLTLCRCQQENLDPVEVAVPARSIAAKLPTAKALIQSDSDVVASRHPKAVDDIKRRYIQLLEVFAQDTKCHQQQPMDGMQAGVELAITQHPWDIVQAVKQQMSALEDAIEIACRYNGDGHHSGVTHLALQVLMMLEGLQKPIAKAVYCRHSVVHRFCSWFDNVSEQNWRTIFLWSNNRSAAQC